MPMPQQQLTEHNINNKGHHLMDLGFAEVRPMYARRFTGDNTCCMDLGFAEIRPLFAGLPATTHVETSCCGTRLARQHREPDVFLDDNESTGQG